MSRDFRITEVSRVGVRMYLAVGHGGAPPTSFAITSITVHRPAGGQQVIVADVNDTGGRAVDLGGSIALAGGPGNTASRPFSAQRIVTLAPGQSGNIPFAPPKGLPNGSSRATITLVSGITTARATATIQLSAIKTAQAGLSDMQRWTWAGLGSLVLLLVIMAQYALRHRRRRVPA